MFLFRGLLINFLKKFDNYLKNKYLLILNKYSKNNSLIIIFNNIYSILKFKIKFINFQL